MWGVGSWQESCQQQGTTTKFQTWCPVTTYSGTNVILFTCESTILIRRCGFDSPTTRTSLLSPLLHSSVVVVLSRYWNGSFSLAQKELVQGKLMSYLVEEMRGRVLRNALWEEWEYLPGEYWVVTKREFWGLFVCFLFFCVSWEILVLQTYLASTHCLLTPAVQCHSRFLFIEIYYLLFYPFMFPSF